MSDFLQQFRAQYPEYNDVADDNLVAGLHDKYRQDIAPNMSLDQFKTSIGYQPIQPPALADVPDIAGQAPQPVQQIGVPQSPQPKSMFDRVNEKLLNMGAGALERGSTLLSNTLESTRTLSQPLDDKYNTGLIGFEKGSFLPTYFSADEVKRRRIPNYSDQATQALEGADFGFQEDNFESWDDVKQKASTNGFSVDTLSSIAEFGLGTTIQSIPDMAAAMTALPLYIAGRSQEIGESRAQNSGREKATVNDVAIAAPFAVASAVLERIGAKGMTDEMTQKLGDDLLKAGFAKAAARVAGAGGRSMSKEATTEAIQEGMIEYVGERFGTDAAMSFAEAGDRALAGAVGGGVGGGAIGASGRTAQEIGLAAQRARLNLDQKQSFTVSNEGQPSKAVVQTIGALAPAIDRTQFGDTSQAAAAAFDPRNAQVVQSNESSPSIQRRVDEEPAAFKPPALGENNSDFAIDREGNQDISMPDVIQKAINQYDNYDSTGRLSKDEITEFKKITGVQVDRAFPYMKVREKPKFVRGKNVPDLYSITTKGRLVNDQDTKTLLKEMFGDQEPPVQISVIGKNKDKKGKTVWHKDSIVSVLFNTQEEADAYAALVKRDFGKPFDMPKSQKAERNMPGNVDVEYKPNQQVEQKVASKNIIETPVSELSLSKDLPQFKTGANKQGVVEPLGGFFDRNGVGPIQVWVREDGRKEVISGRHRLDLAKRSGETTIPAQYHYESEGFDQDQAAMLDALLNIREGQGKVKDYVEFIKGTAITREEADAQGILARQTGQRAYTVATQGSDALIAAHRNDSISDEAAERLTNAAPNNDGLQAVGLEALSRGKSLSYAENLIKALSLFKPSQTAEQQGDLFGFDDAAMKQAARMAEIAAARQKELQKSLSAIRGASKNPELARKQGVDVKDPQAVQARAKELEKQKKALDNWPTNKTISNEIRKEAGGEDSIETVDIENNATQSIDKSYKPQEQGNETLSSDSNQTLKTPTFRELNDQIATKKARADDLINTVNDIIRKPDVNRRYTREDAESMIEQRKDLLRQIQDHEKQYKELGYENEKMPEKVSVAFGEIKTKPIGGKLYRETNVRNLESLLMHALGNNPQRGSIDATYMSDNQDLAIGQGDNKGVMVVFDGNYVSGAEHKKPFSGMADTLKTGREFKTDYIHKNAIESITMPESTKIKPSYQGMIDRNFNKTSNGDGTVTYTRKGLPTAQPVKRLTDEPQVEVIPSKKSKAVGKPVKPLKQVKHFNDLPEDFQQRIFKARGNRSALDKILNSLYDSTIPAQDRVNRLSAVQREISAIEWKGHIPKTVEEFEAMAAQLGEENFTTAQSNAAKELLDAYNASVIDMDKDGNITNVIAPDQPVFKTKSIEELDREFEGKTIEQVQELLDRTKSRYEKRQNTTRDDIEPEIIANLEKWLKHHKKPLDRDIEPPRADQEPIKKKETVTSDEMKAFYAAKYERQLKVEDVKNNFKRLKNSRDTMIAELNSKAYKKDDLIRLSGTYRNDLKKAQLAELAYDEMLKGHIFKDSFVISFSFGEKASDQYEALVNSQTQADIDNYYTLQANKAQAQMQALESRKKALDNPETLEEFNVFIRVKGKSALTTEQLATYDEMVANSLKPEDKPKIIKTLDKKVQYTRSKTRHAKKDIDLFVVSLTNKLDKSEYTELLGKAKALGGYYSTYTKQGAVAGFQFQSEDNADSFASLLDNENIDISNQAEAKAYIKKAAQADKLVELADSIEAKADTVLTADRKTNTAKRARESGHAIEAASKQIEFSQTLRKIAAGVASGDINHLGGIKTATQLENLMDIRADFKPYTRPEEQQPALEDFIHNVKIKPILITSTSARNVAKALTDKKGYARLTKSMNDIVKSGQDSTLSIDQAKQIIKAQKEGHIDKYEAWTVPLGVNRLMRLNNIGITTDEQLRAALRELDMIRSTNQPKVSQKDKDLRQLEASLIGAKIDGYFPTPKAIVERMLDIADISDGDSILEPSAGKGNIADVIVSYIPNVQQNIKVIEPVSTLRQILELKGYTLAGSDFLDHQETYDKIIMNPPFEKFQDVDHVRHAFDLLKPKGTLVAIMGAGVKNSRSKAKDFRQWLEDNGGVMEDLEAGSFKSSERSTGVNTVLVTMNKPDAGILSMRSQKSNKDQFNAAVPDTGVYYQGDNYYGTYGAMGLPPRVETMIIDGQVHEMPAAVQRHEPILSSMISIAGRRIYFSKIRGKGRLGFYNSKTGELRTKKANDVEVWAHELAHYLDFYSNVKHPDFAALYKDDRYVNEVMGLSYTSDTQELQQLEGFAEFVRLWLSNSHEVSVRAPLFNRAFNQALQRDQKLYKKMKKMQLQMHQYYLQGPLNNARAKIGSKKSLSERLGEYQIKRLSRTRQQLIDKTHAARRIEQDLKGVVGDFDASAWKQLRIANGGYESVTDSILNQGTVNYDEKGDLVVTGKGLHEILMPVEKIKLRPEDKGKDIVEMLMEYFVGRRASELLKQGRENLFNTQNAQAFVELGESYPEFKTIFAEYQQFNTRMLDFYVSSGLISKEQKIKFREMNRDYVPFFRVREALDASNRGGSSKLGKRLKGGTSNLKDVLLNITEGVQSNVKASLENRAKATLYGYIDTNKDGALFATKIPADIAPVRVHQEQMLKKMKDVFKMIDLDFDDYFVGTDSLDIAVLNAGMSQGADVDKRVSLDAMLDPDMLLFWQMGVTPKLNESGNTLDYYLINGKPRYYEVQDPMLHEMLMGMNPHSYGLFMRSMFAVKNGFTRSITLGIEFTGANLVRDTIGAAILSKGKFIPFIDSFKGMYSFFKQDEYFQEWLRHGGGYSSRLDTLSQERNARRRVQIKNFGALSYYERFISVFDNFVSAFEYGTRVGEFRIAKKEGQSSFDSAYRAREISTDFSVTGASTFWSGYVRTIPFFNAMIQSQDRVYRELLINKKYDGNPYRFAMKSMIGIALPSVLLWMMNHDDDDYKRIPEAEKRTNWHIPIGDRFIKIPKPYDVGFVFGTIPEMFLTYVEDREGRKFARGLAWTLLQMYGVDGTPAAATGLVDLILNRDWTGAPVVPKNMEGVSLVNQYNTRTSDIFIQFGDMTGLSPVQAEHAFRAYTGYLGGYVLAGTDYMMWDNEKFGPMPEKDFSESPFLKRFITTDVRSYTSDMDRFWELKEKSDQVVADIKKGVSARQLAKDKNVDLEKRYLKDKFWGYTQEEKQVLEALQKSMQSLVTDVYGDKGINTQQMIIRYNKDMTAKQKRDELESLWQQKNYAFRQMVQGAEDALKAAKTVAD